MKGEKVTEPNDAISFSWTSRSLYQKRCQHQIQDCRQIAVRTWQRSLRPCCAPDEKVADSATVLHRSLNDMSFNRYQLMDNGWMNDFFGFKVYKTRNFCRCVWGKCICIADPRNVMVSFESFLCWVAVGFALCNSHVVFQLFFLW